MTVYEWADTVLNACPRYETGFSELLSVESYRVSPTVRRLYDARLPIIRAFQQISLDLFRAALNHETDPCILHWLLNETPESMGISYHRALEERHFTLPVFFRTDEVKPGRIIEIQCPGCLWGELQLLYEYTARLGCGGGGRSPADQFADQLVDLLGVKPIVQHYLDKASAPAGMRYFIEKTRQRVKYWGIDRGIQIRDCNFIRHHAFSELWADDNLASQLAKTGDGLRFDLPPHVLFDQKATLALPFWSLTRECFSDEIRSLFPYISPLLSTGIELPGGERVSIKEFSRFPKSQRAYFLKLAGYDNELNWGSKAVYRLSNLGSGACYDFLQECLSGYEAGRIWL
ncbi:MAG TPA: hypothetical protein VF813_10360, partial [Anaerolineaceae bacterium]